MEWLRYKPEDGEVIYYAFIVHTECTLEPIVGSEVLLSHVLTSQVQSEHQDERDTSVNPTSLEAVEPSSRETPEVLPHNLLLIRRNTVQNLTAGALGRNVKIE